MSIEAQLRTLLIALAVAAAPAWASAAGPLEVRQPWSRPAVAGTNGIGYLVVANHGRAADSLEKVESPIAARVEMHAMSMAGGVMSMKKVDRIAVPAGGETAFAPPSRTATARRGRTPSPAAPGSPWAWSSATAWVRRRPVAERAAPAVF